MLAEKFWWLKLNTNLEHLTIDTSEVRTRVRFPSTNRTDFSDQIMLWEFPLTPPLVNLVKWPIRRQCRPLLANQRTVLATPDQSGVCFLFIFTLSLIIMIMILTLTVWFCIWCLVFCLFEILDSSSEKWLFDCVTSVNRIWDFVVKISLEA